MADFKRLIRFQDSDGAVRYGEAEDGVDLVGQRVSVYSGTDPWALQMTGETAEVVKVLCPLRSSPIIYGVGLNYKHHIQEAGFPLPKFPTVFTKPSDALAGPFEEITVNTGCLEMDYEGELCIVIGRDMKNFSEGDNPLEYVLGYTVGNDLSSRYWQTPERSGHQHGMAKSFDKFAPIGPAIISPRHLALKDNTMDGIPDLLLCTQVNGEVRQRARTSDLVFGLTDIFTFLSRGRTIRAGTLIMTGTPGGVGAFMKPPAWLESGDIVEVRIEHIGVIQNHISLE